MKAGAGQLPVRFYAEHVRHFPVATVDIVVMDRMSRFLLVKRSRSNFTWKGVWATPGGRVHRNERIRNAANRILERETRIRAKPGDFIFRGVVEFITPKEHAVSTVFSVVTGQKILTLDETSSAVRWFGRRELPASLKREYRSMLSMVTPNRDKGAIVPPNR